jgi:hypothetical protein
MKYVCLGYIAPGKFENMSEGERNAFVDGCFTYDDVLRKNGHFTGGEALQPASSAVTLRHQGGKVIVTDGPYAETKEQLLGFYIVDCKNLDEALDVARDLGAANPGGAYEIRPVGVLNPWSVTT